MRLALSAAALTLGLAGCKPDAPPPPPPPPPAATPDAPTPPAAPRDTSYTFADANRRLRVSIEYPYLPDGPAAVNTAIAASARALGTRFADAVGASDAQGPAEAENVSEGGVQTLFATGRLVSGRFEVLETVAGAAHPNLVASSFTFDRTTGRAVELSDLFLPGTAYLDTLSAQARRMLRSQFTDAQAPDAEMFDEGTKPDRASFRVFTVHPDGLRLFFPPDTIGPYAIGSREVLLPWSGLQTVLRPDGPAAWI